MPENPVLSLVRHLSASSPGAVRRLPVLLRRAWYGLNQAFRRRIAHTGCTPDQYIVLRNLVEGASGGLTQADLTRMMSSDANTMASLLRRMEVLGLIRRCRDSRDGRARRVHLEKRGGQLFRQVRRIALRLERDVLSGLESGARGRFLEDLERVAGACRSAAEE